uniref:Uncharacterized protein n=1 Tax=Rhodosorus marinus TaxID=101924 RepID=A0A7S0BE72_9RHOD|mmetsp:Transcript_10959/g.15802  ORF Transcript_10959/g.15802 Transcript_10959/m.15802 type:complete len:105 (+) Transcript_10959:827-1141(+)
MVELHILKIKRVLIRELRYWTNSFYQLIVRIVSRTLMMAKRGAQRTEETMYNAAEILTDSSLRGFANRQALKSNTSDLPSLEYNFSLGEQMRPQSRRVVIEEFR